MSITISSTKELNLLLGKMNTNFPSVARSLGIEEDNIVPFQKFLQDSLDNKHRTLTVEDNGTFAMHDNNKKPISFNSPEITKELVAIKQAYIKHTNAFAQEPPAPASKEDASKDGHGKRKEVDTTDGKKKTEDGRVEHTVNTETGTPPAETPAPGSGTDIGKAAENNTWGLVGTLGGLLLGMLMGGEMGIMGILLMALVGFALGSALGDKGKGVLGGLFGGGSDKEKHEGDGKTREAGTPGPAAAQSTSPPAPGEGKDNKKDAPAKPEAEKKDAKPPVAPEKPPEPKEHGKSVMINASETAAAATPAARVETVPFEASTTAISGNLSGAGIFEQLGSKIKDAVAPLAAAAVAPVRALADAASPTVNEMLDPVREFAKDKGKVTLNKNVRTATFLVDGAGAFSDDVTGEKRQNLVTATPPDMEKKAGAMYLRGDITEAGFRITGYSMANQEGEFVKSGLPDKDGKIRDDGIAVADTSRAMGSKSLPLIPVKQGEDKVTIDFNTLETRQAIAAIRSGETGKRTEETRAANEKKLAKKAEEKAKYLKKLGTEPIIAVTHKGVDDWTGQRPVTISYRALNERGEEEARLFEGHIEKGKFISGRGAHQEYDLVITSATALYKDGDKDKRHTPLIDRTIIGNIPADKEGKIDADRIKNELGQKPSGKYAGSGRGTYQIYDDTLEKKHPVIEKLDALVKATVPPPTIESGLLAAQPVGTGKDRSEETTR